MPLTSTGKKVLSNMRKKYGNRAESVFYASINAKKSGSSKWHKKTKKTYYSKETIRKAAGK